MSDPGPCACALMPCDANRGATAATSAQHARIHCCLASEGACHGLDFEVTHLDNSGCERPHEELRAWLDRERGHQGGAP